MKRKLSLLLAALAAAGALSVSALATEAEPPAQENQEQTREETVTVPDPEGTVTWENLRSRIQEGSLSLQSLTESIGSIQAIDYDKMAEVLREQINAIGKASRSGGTSVSASASSLRDTFEDLLDGDYQADNDDVIWQLRDASNQVVSAGENLYITLVGMEQSAQDMERDLDALDRRLEDARLRLELGQGSRQTVKDLEQSRTEMASQLNTLNTNISKYKSQLQTLLGETPTGELTLGELPGEEEMDWSEPDYETDLAAAKTASWTLRSAEKTLEDAEEDWKDAKKYAGSKPKYELEVAEHTWNSAQLTYESAVQDFETSFKQLYDALADYEQVLESRKSALDYQEEQLTVTEKKYELGRASRYDVLTARDNVAAAQSDVDSTWRDLFSARNSYQWAVEYGLL